MKQMRLSEEEVELVLNHRREAAKNKEEERIRLIRESRNHDWKFDFQNYKCYYYKCTKCGSGKVE